MKKKILICSIFSILILFLNYKLNNQTIIDSTPAPLTDFKNQESIHTVENVSTISDISDYNDKEISVTLNQVSDFSSLSASSGVYISTEGYYKANDGGGAIYCVTDDTSIIANNITSFKLNNGFIAQLVLDDMPSFLQFGAIGDGIADNNNSLYAAIDMNINSLYFPNGDYYFSSNEFNLKSSLSLFGESQEKTILHNLCLIAPYGLCIENVTFDSGQYHTIWVATIGKSEGTFQIIATPSGESNISYHNCTFKNVDYASFAMTNEETRANHFTSDNISDCTFENIGYVAVFHGVDSDQSSFTNNIFNSIGSSSYLSGTIGALKIGDTTNHTTIGSKNCIIANNLFTNLYSANDLSNTKHTITCNFITIFGEYAEIKNNRFENLYGYGNDREAIYTKVKNIRITDNYIENGGFGEGYITNKGYKYDSDTSYVISNNTIVGEYGIGIVNWGPAEICSNTIEITSCRSAIVCYGKDLVDSNSSLLIEDNIINCANGELYINDAKVDTYISKYLVQIEYANFPIYLDMNEINANNSTLNSVVRAGGVRNDIYITNNTISSSLSASNSIQISSSTDYEYDSANSNISIENNTLDKSMVPILISMKNKEVSPSRMYSIMNNSIEYDDSNTKYPILLSLDSNQDTLRIDEKVIAYTTTKYVENKSSTPVVQSYKE